MFPRAPAARPAAAALLRRLQACDQAPDGSFFYAYAAVQRNAMQVWRGEGRFLDLLNADPQVSAVLKPADLEALFDLGYHFKHVDTVFERVFGAG